jgi:hypothetical protein
MIAFQSALSCSGWMLERNTIRADVQLAVARIWSERVCERGAAAHIRQCAMEPDS